LVYLGTISYGIYMFHAGVWWACRQAFRLIFKVDDFLVLDPISSLILLLIEVLLTIVLAAISYKMLEVPINNYRKKI
jgi:peptidoglycan/LPS O-acetylase OafA/YrhL